MPASAAGKTPALRGWPRCHPSMRGSPSSQPLRLSNRSQPTPAGGSRQNAIPHQPTRGESGARPAGQVPGQFSPTGRLAPSGPRLPPRAKPSSRRPAGPSSLSLGAPDPGATSPPEGIPGGLRPGAAARRFCTRPALTVGRLRAYLRAKGWRDFRETIPAPCAFALCPAAVPAVGPPPHRSRRTGPAGTVPAALSQQAQRLQYPLLPRTPR